MSQNNKPLDINVELEYLKAKAKSLDTRIQALNKARMELEDRVQTLHWLYLVIVGILILERLFL